MMPFFSPLDFLRDLRSGRRDRRSVSAAHVRLALSGLRDRPGCCSGWGGTVGSSLLLGTSLLCCDTLCLFGRNTASLLRRTLRGRGGRSPTWIGRRPGPGRLTRNGSGRIRRPPGSGGCRCGSTGRGRPVAGSSLLLCATPCGFPLLCCCSCRRGTGRTDIIGGRLRTGRTGGTGGSSRILGGGIPGRCSRPLYRWIDRSAVRIALSKVFLEKSFIFCVEFLRFIKIFIFQ